MPADFRDFQNNQDYSDEDGFYQDDGSSPTFQSYDMSGVHESDMDERPRVPLIVLAQQNQYPPPAPEPTRRRSLWHIVRF